MFFLIARVKRNLTWLMIVLLTAAYLTLSQIPSTFRCSKFSFFPQFDTEQSAWYGPKELKNVKNTFFC